VIQITPFPRDPGRAGRGQQTAHPNKSAEPKIKSIRHYLRARFYLFTGR
jgi:hypothetical protein